MFKVIYLRLTRKLKIVVLVGLFTLGKNNNLSNKFVLE